MKKRIAAIMIIAIIALTAIIITSCSDSNGEEAETTITTTIYSETNAGTDNPQVQEPPESDNMDWVELHNINFIPDETKKGVIKAQTDTAIYTFYGRTEEENIKLAQITDIAASMITNKYGYSLPTNRVIWFIGEESVQLASNLSGVTQAVMPAGAVVINPDAVWSVGALFYRMSSQTLPAWLAAGLELYLSDKLGFERFAIDKEFDVKAWQAEIADFSALDDTWFAQYNDNINRLSTAFCFIKWLDENGLLDEIIRAYLSDKQDEGDLLFADAWQTFTGYDIRKDFSFENRFRYLYGLYLQNHNKDWEYYFFSVLTEHGHYFFDWYPENEKIEKYINNIDTQYIYAKQWLGFENTAPIPTRIQVFKDGWSAGGAEYVYLAGKNPLVAVHESFHHLLYARDIIAYNIAWLNEGLPEGIQFIYADEDPEFYGAGFLDAYAKGDTNAFIEEVSSLYQSLTGKEYEYNGTFDWKHYEHIKALEAVNYFIENDRYGSYSGNIGQLLTIRANDKPSAFPQGYLNSYPTAASFVIYMLEIGSKDDFMRLYTDISLAEELYGKDFNALYEQWLEFLRKI